MTTLDSAELSRAGRFPTLCLSLGNATVIEVEYPASMEIDTHAHERAYLCLVARGSFEEWGPAGGRRTVVEGSDPVYAEDSRHAVRTGERGVRMLHVTDPVQAGWSVSSRLRAGILRQLAYGVRRLGTEPTDDAEAVHLESLVHELGDGAGPGGAEPGWLTPVRRHLRDAYARPLRLEELAGLAGLHPSHFAREFRRWTGHTAGAYLRRLRVAAAVHRIRDTREPFSRIAYTTGFADQSHMGRWVRRYVGSTPGALRPDGDVSGA